MVNSYVKFLVYFWLNFGNWDVKNKNPSVGYQSIVKTLKLRYFNIFKMWICVWYKEILTSSLKSILVNTRPDSLESISSLDKQTTSGM